MSDFNVEINVLFLAFVFIATWFSYKRGYQQGSQDGVNTILFDIHNVARNVMNEIIQQSRLSKEDKDALKDVQFEFEYQDKE